MWGLCLILVLGWYWLHRMSLVVFPTLLFLENFKEKGYYVFSICLIKFSGKSTLWIIFVIKIKEIYYYLCIYTLSVSIQKKEKNSFVLFPDVSLGPGRMPVRFNQYGLDNWAINKLVNIRVQKNIICSVKKIIGGRYWTQPSILEIHISYALSIEILNAPLRPNVTKSKDTP